MIGLNLNLPRKVEDKLEYLSFVSKRPKEFYVEEAIMSYWEDLEDLADALVSLNESEKHYTTKEVLEMIDNGTEI